MIFLNNISKRDHKRIFKNQKAFYDLGIRQRRLYEGDRLPKTGTIAELIFRLYGKFKTITNGTECTVFDYTKSGELEFKIFTFEGAVIDKDDTDTDCVVFLGEQIGDHTVLERAKAINEYKFLFDKNDHLKRLCVFAHEL